MLDVLAISESSEASSSSSSSSNNSSAADGKDRPCTVAAHVLIFDQDWCCCNRDSIIDGLSIPEVGALALHQTGVRPNQLWLSPQVSVQSVASSSLSNKGDSSAPDPGDDVLESPEMILEAGSHNIDYLDAILKCSKEVLKRR